MSYLINQYFYPPRQIYLNSKFATSTPDPVKNNRCFFAIESIIIPNAYDNILVSIDDAQIPISFYTINETNNSIDIAFYADDIGNYDPDLGKNSVNYRDPNAVVGYMKTYTIPVGNYDAYNLSATLTTIVNDDYKLYMPYLQFTCTYDEGINKFTFNIENSDPLYASLSTGLWVSFPNGTFGASVWGFSAVKNLDGSVTYAYSIDAPIVAPYCCDLAGLRFAFIQCPTFGTCNVNSKTGGTNQILAKIPITQDYLAIEQYMNYNGYVNKIHNNKSLTVIEIIILDDNLNDINFNGVHWAITMNISILGQPPEQIQTIESNILN